MSVLTEFLLARYAEDEETARDASHRSAEWVVQEERPDWGIEDDAVVLGGGKPLVVCDLQYSGGLVSEHIARWDPARVLAECEAKRRIVDAEVLREVGPASHYVSPEVHAAIARRTATPVLRLLALPYADHPDYLEDYCP